MCAAWTGLPHAGHGLSDCMSRRCTRGWQGRSQTGLAWVLPGRAPRGLTGPEMLCILIWKEQK